MSLTLTPLSLGTLGLNVAGIAAQSIFDVRTFGSIGVSAAQTTATIQAMESARSAVGGIGFFPQGTFEVNQVLQPSASGAWIGGGAGTVLKMASGTNLAGIVQVSGLSNFTIARMRFDGNGSNQASGGDAIRLVSSCADCYVIDCVISNGYSTAQGILFSGGSRNAAINCDISSYGKGITQSSSPTDTLILACKIRSCTSTSQAEGGLYLANGARTRIESCLIASNATNGVFLGTADDVSVIGCTIMSNGGSTSGRRGISCDSSAGPSRARIIGNYFYNNAEQSLWTGSNTPDGLFDGNVATGNNVAAVSPTAGLEIDSTGWTVSNNRIVSNLGTGCDGIFIGGGSTTVIGNVIKSNGRRGLYVFGTGLNDCVISGNIIKNNGQSTNQCGIEINGNAGTAARHIVTGNIVNDDSGASGTQTTGLVLASSTDRVLYDGNVFVTNKTSATSIAGTNHSAGTNIAA